MVVDCMDEIIIWGAGKVAVNRLEWAAFAGYQVLFFIDNDTAKCGKRIRGISICSPEILKGHKWTIVIPDVYLKEVNRQLNKISYQGQRIGFDQFKKEAVCRKNISIDFSDIKPGNKICFLFDSYFAGLNWGGVESWSCMVANGLSNLNVETQLICGLNKKFDECTTQCLHFYNKNELDMLKEMAVNIAAFLPCIFITHGSIALNAAQIVKSAFPDQIKLVAVAHGDEENTYKMLRLWSDQLDKIICISKKIYVELQKKYGLKKEILLYRPNPIQIPFLEGRRINHEEPLRIGFAARLRKEQKRVHLLPEIIDTCLRKGRMVEFDIVGEGDCLELLRSYVSDRNLENKVHILGWMSPTEMTKFWKNEDIYLNISDFEGMSLAMLEAMACGAVPVVTDVSGVDDLIDDGKNGFVVPVDGWMEAADKIELLDKDRTMLQRASEYNMSLIRRKCNISDYAKWMVDTFHF